VFPEHVGARIAHKCWTLYLRRLISHVLIDLIKGSFHDYHKSGLFGGEVFNLYPFESTYWFYLFKVGCLYHYCIHCFYRDLLKNNVFGFKLLKIHS